MDIKQLREMQSWTLDQKVYHAMEVIDVFYNRLGGSVYVSFSGGKDSTVLLWLARKVYPNMRAAFCNTGNEYPDIVRFVRSFDNIDWIKPSCKPQDVLEKYGFPLVSKQVSYMVSGVRNNPNSAQSIKFMGKRSKKNPYYVIPDKWRYLTSTNYDVSQECCHILKKEPFRKYEKENGMHPIMGTMASESKMRETDYLRHGGCNIFSDDGNSKTKSMPLSIWLEKDVWDCVEKYHIPISDIYKKGAKRTGCMFCGYGCQFSDDNRLKMIYDLYPKWYDRFMNYSNNGVTYREVLRKALAINKLQLPDEDMQLEIPFID